MRKLLLLSLASASLLASAPLRAISLDDIPLWTGSGSNRAAVVIEWNSPVDFDQTTVAAPLANKTMVWGYRFNGSAVASDMVNAVLAADRRLYAVEIYYPGFGHFVQALGYNLNGDGVFGISDGTNVYSADSFTSNCLIDPNLDLDAGYPLNSGDLYWGGLDGPNWTLWNELGDAGDFNASPNRGTNQYWNPNTYTHGQWAESPYGLDVLPLTDGSWIGFSVSLGYPDDTNSPSYATDMAAFTNDVQAPPSPDGTYTAYVLNTNDYAVQVVSSSDLDTASPYNSPAAVLGRPTLTFNDAQEDRNTNEFPKIIEPPYGETAAGNDVITEIKSGGQITVEMGRKVYANPANPYGLDLIVYGNSFFSASGVPSVNNGTDLNNALLSTSIAGHATIVSVSQDGISWHAFNTVTTLFPDDSYRWDDTNASWTSEVTNPTKPINPYLITNNFGGVSTAVAMDQFVGAAGGSGYNLCASGLPWIQYVRVQPGAGAYTVIDAIAAVNPAVVGDALSIAPDNIISGVGALSFQKPSDVSETLLSLQFTSVSEAARVSTFGLSEFSAYAPVAGVVSAAYGILVRPVEGSDAIACQANVGLRPADNYTGNGSDLRVYQWNGTHWSSEPFTFNAACNQAIVDDVTNLSAFVVSQVITPQLSILLGKGGPSFQFTPVPNCAHVLERSSDLVTWTPICTNIAPDNQPLVLQDSEAPATKAFYRLSVNVP